MYFSPVDFDRFEELIAFFERSKDRWHGGGDMFAVFQHFDAMLGVIRRIGGDEDRFDLVVLDHLFQRRIRLRATPALASSGAAVGDQIADGDDSTLG